MLVRESLDDILKPKELSPALEKRWKQEELKNAAKDGDVARFLRGINAGLKISYPLFRKMITDWDYRRNAADILSSVDWSDFEQIHLDKIKIEIAVFNKSLENFKDAIESGSKISYKVLRLILDEYRHRDEFLNYIQTLDLDKVTEPKDRKKIKDIFNLDSPQEHRSYPRAYKQYRVLKYIKERKVTQRQQLIKLIYELGYGPNTFHPINDRGYWSANYHNVIGRYYDKVDGKFVLNDEGKEKLKELHKKFKNMEDERLKDPFR